MWVQSLGWEGPLEKGQPAPARARTLEAGKRLAGLAQARAVAVCTPPAPEPSAERPGS